MFPTLTRESSPAISIAPPADGAMTRWGTSEVVGKQYCAISTLLLIVAGPEFVGHARLRSVPDIKLVYARVTHM